MLTVIAQLLNTLLRMSGYLSSSIAKTSRARTGAGRCSLVLPVKVEAAAKYRIEKWPLGALADAMMPVETR
jgi:hypothetical protein